ncbi:Protein fdhD (plasmid) [Gemmatirosa kalamazoonensis]|uniref:Sulfur carrier protein FdhD n=1 Tax=Gemmatirosa kalamazoonensis TaxID=861299 RepID=W0RQY3_9BACT|nr:formate dehydrogenase accessory sulfurtransferase FdhD [Gemmatirosa kalamazoonensis]AHG93121.1 Protein fdhD [Gemmatirosa kalamazoonensis]
MRQERVIEVPIDRVRGDERREELDVLAVEEPLEIRVQLGRHAAGPPRTLSVTMRTPGGDLEDAELAVGFLVGEGVVRGRAEVLDVRRCGPVSRPVPNAIRVTLGGAPDLSRLDRHVVTTSACGVCGKTSIDALRPIPTWPLAAGEPGVDAAVVHRLPAALRDAQAVFARTGGLHAAALFAADGTLLTLREDVGRHNAVDKVVGAELLAGRLPARDRVLLVSGRASFELVLKAVMAGVPVLAAVGAPSSLAVSLASESGLTLLGFVRDGRFNVYAGAGRVRGAVVGSSAMSLP